MLNDKRPASLPLAGLFFVRQLTQFGWYVKLCQLQPIEGMQMKNRDMARWAVVIAIALVLATIFVQPVDAANSPASMVTFDSKHGESMDEFVKRIAPLASTRTKIYGNTEICGEIESTAEGYRVEFYSTNSDYSCDYLKHPGRSYTGQTVHTHPRGPGYATTSFSESDFNHPGYLILNPVRVLHQQGHGTEREVKAAKRR